MTKHPTAFARHCRQSLLLLAAVATLSACGQAGDSATLADAAYDAAQDIGASGVAKPLDAQLFHAVAANDGAAVASLLDQGADVNAANVLGRTPIYSAAFYRRTAIGKLLLSRGARTDVHDATGLTPLHVAVLAGDADLVGLLVAAAADVNARSSSGKTPLHLAAATGQPAMVHLLLKLGADKTLKDNHGETAVTLGEHNRHRQTVAALQ